MGIRRQGRRPSWGPRITAIGTLGDVFVWGIAHSGKAVSWQALSKVTKVTLLFTRRILYTKLYRRLRRGQWALYH